MNAISSIAEKETSNPRTFADLLNMAEIGRFCQRWQITELALFGSALRDDFGPTSDVDVLVTFAPEANWGLLDHVQMEQELADLIGKEVDMVTKKSVEMSHNWRLKQEILQNSQVVFQK
ncbi:MAG TPA: nucleotidyltransferase family protein [Chloroflexota bacterium]|nr:nucleotidyltransferase family protein [Chloroflexota bacterium]